MRSIYETVLWRRSPEEIEKICKDIKLSRSWKITDKSGLKSYRLIDSVTRDVKYKWLRGETHLPIKKWYAKNCPKVSHDYTLGELFEDALHSPTYHVFLAFVWIAITSYIHYYKATTSVSEGDENKLAAGIIVSSLFLHFYLYHFLFTFFHVLLLLNPITIPAIIIILNLAKSNTQYKDYLWKVNLGFSALYSVLGLLMAWVSLWF